MLGGYEAYSTDPEELNYKGLVYRLSENGEEIIWSKDFGIPYTTSSSADVVNNDDQSFYTSGNSGGYDDDLIMYISKCAYSNGAEIIRKEYDNYIIDGTFRNFGNGNIIGSYWKINNDPGETDITHKPVLIRFDEQLDTLWTSTIYSILGEADYMRDIKLCPDGGYLLTGFNYTRQATWMVKTDSMGRTCHPANCDSTFTSISSLPIVENPYRVAISPNPVSGKARLIHHIPIINRPALLEIYNASGILVMKQVLHLSEGDVELDFSGLAAGIYIYKLHTASIDWWSGKLVVSN